jgi:hypothetical protein
MDGWMSARLDAFDDLSTVWVHTNTTLLKQRTSTATTSAISQK